MKLQIQTAYIRRFGQRTEYRGTVKGDGSPVTLRLTADALPADFACTVNGQVPAWEPPPAAESAESAALLPPGEPVIALSFTALPEAALRLWLTNARGEWVRVCGQEKE